MKLLVCLLVSLCLLQRQAEAIHCYSCQSYHDRTCAGKALDKFKTNCSDVSRDRPLVACRLVYQEMEFQQEGMPYDIRFIRECGEFDPKYAGKCYQTVGLGAKQIICSCDKDFCNSSLRAMPNLIIVLLVSFLIYVRAKLV